jgi:hypothetical protein
VGFIDFSSRHFRTELLDFMLSGFRHSCSSSYQTYLFISAQERPLNVRDELSVATMIRGFIHRERDRFLKHLEDNGHGTTIFTLVFQRIPMVSIIWPNFLFQHTLFTTSVCSDSLEFSRPSIWSACSSLEVHITGPNFIDQVLFHWLPPYLKFLE